LKRRLSTTDKATRDKEQMQKLWSVISKLRDQLKEAEGEKERFLKEIDEAKKEDEKQENRQMNKLLWLNRELTNQIRERDIQTDKLKQDYAQLQKEDLQKANQLDHLKQEISHEQLRHKGAKDTASLNILALAAKHDWEKERSDSLEKEELKHEITLLKTQVQIKSQELNMAKNEATTLEDRQKHLQHEIQNANTHLKKELNAITASSAKMQKTLKGKDKEIDKLQGQYLHSEQDNTVLRQRIKELESYFYEYMKLTGNNRDAEQMKS